MSTALLKVPSTIWLRCALLTSMMLWTATGSGQEYRFTVFDLEGNARASIARSTESGVFHNPVLSPDGTSVALRETRSGDASDLWVWDLETGERKQLTFAEPRDHMLDSAVWSPDGTRLAYATLRGANYGIYEIRADGAGTERPLYRHDGGPLFVVNWSPDGQSINFLKPNPYARDQSQRTLYTLRLDQDNRVYETLLPEAMPSTRSNGGQSGAVALSPNGQWLAYAVAENDAWEVYVRRLAESSGSVPAAEDRWRVSNGDAYDLISWRNDSRELYYLTAQGIMGVAVDSESEPIVQPSRLVATVTTAMRAVFRDAWPRRLANFGPQGDLFVFPVAPDPAQYRITLFDRHGEMTGTVGPVGIYDNPTLSPDGTKVLVGRMDLETGFTDAWTFDVETGDGRRMTSDWAAETRLAWHPNGGIGYVKNRAGFDNVYLINRNGNGEELLFRYLPGTEVWLGDFSSDGRYLNFTSGGMVLLVPLDSEVSERRAIEFGRAEFVHEWGRFSPVANLIAYISNETGESQLYVQDMNPATGGPGAGKWQLTRNGATPAVSWRRDGNEIYYVQPASTSRGRSVMVVSIDTTDGFRASEPEELFVLPRDVPNQRFLSPDGEQFVLLVPESNSVN